MQDTFLHEKRAIQSPFSLQYSMIHDRCLLYTSDIIDRDVSPYTNVINTSVKDDKIDVKVEAVVVDDRELLISTIQDFSKRKDIKKHMKQLDGDVERLGIWGLEFDSFDEIRKELKERPEEDPCLLYTSRCV